MTRPADKARDKKLVGALLRWYRRHYRDLPWRRTKDPYPIWVSEVMLQQTRVTTALPYYERFLKEFPDVHELAGAPEAKLLAVWSGLGYYRRARQMQQAAKVIVTEHGGVFPDSYDGLLVLPGIGPYTAAAIASISFNRAHAVVDGNVIRVMSRFINESGEVSRTETKERLRRRMQTLGEAGASRRFGLFNQAVMELGATVCTLRNPGCMSCPLRDACQACRLGVQGLRPVKAIKERSVKLEMAVAVVRHGSHYLMRERPEDCDLMPGFWELPEVTGAALADDCFDALGIRRGEHLGNFRHGITFRSYRGSVYRSKIEGRAPACYRWVPEQRLEEMPLTTVARKALRIALDARNR